jgi:hypothetical protein
VRPGGERRLASFSRVFTCLTSMSMATAHTHTHTPSGGVFTVRRTAHRGCRRLAE